MVSDARANKQSISYSYQSRALGNQGYQSLTVRPNASDPTLKALKEAGSITDAEFNKIISSGVTAIIPAATATNLISSRLQKDDRQVILDNVGTYRYINPNGNIDMTFTKNPNGSITATGTMYDSRKGMTDIFTQNNLNNITFSNLLNSFDAIR
jgi:dynactin complex subunit